MKRFGVLFIAVLLLAFSAPKVIATDAVGTMRMILALSGGSGGSTLSGTIFYTEGNDKTVGTTVWGRCNSSQYFGQIPLKIVCSSYTVQSTAGMFDKSKYIPSTRLEYRGAISSGTKYVNGSNPYQAVVNYDAGVSPNAVRVRIFDGLGKAVPGADGNGVTLPDATVVVN